MTTDSNAQLITVHGVGSAYCRTCGHDDQYHYMPRTIHGALSTARVCEREGCRCGHAQSPRLAPVVEFAGWSTPGVAL